MLLRHEVDAVVTAAAAAAAGSTSTEEAAAAVEAGAATATAAAAAGSCPSRAKAGLRSDRKRAASRAAIAGDAISQALAHRRHFRYWRVGIFAALELLFFFLFADRGNDERGELFWIGDPGHALLLEKVGHVLAIES